MAIAQFSGLASGIDSGSLIDAIIEARELQNEIRRDNIDHLESENDALEELNTKFLALEEMIDAFRTVNGGGIDKKGSSTDPTVATATVGSNAVNASYSLSVTSIADTATGSFNNSYTSSSDYVSTTGDGTVTVAVGTGSDQIDIVANVTQNSTTLTQLADAINADSDAEGRVTASVVNIGTDASPDYRLLLTTLETGTAEGSLSLSSTVGELGTSTVDQATNAVFTISGISTAITRDSNDIDDVISGVTFNLIDTGSTSISIGNDASSTAADIQEIVDTYNEIVEYVNENDTVEQVEDDDDGTNVYGTLAKTRIDNDFLSAFRMVLAGAEADSGNEVTSMSELGLSTNRDGTITFDEDEFTESVSADPDGATSVLNDFADQLAGVSGVIYQYTKLNGFIDIAQSGNDSEIDTIQDSIDALERRTEKLRESLEKQFTNLETISSDLQSQQSALSSALSGLG